MHRAVEGGGGEIKESKVSEIYLCSYQDDVMLSSVLFAKYFFLKYFDV